MRKFLLATHCDMAQCMKRTTEYLLGQQENLDVINAYMEDDFDLTLLIADKLSKLGNSDELIVMTDMFGGSINNEFMLTLTDPRIYLLTGINLPLIIELVTAEEDSPALEVIDQAIQIAQGAVRFCNTIRKEGNIQEEDF